MFARYVLNDAPGWTEPLALLLLNTAMMFGAAAGVHAARISVSSSGAPLAARVAPADANLARLIAALVGTLFAVWGGEMLLDGWDCRWPARRCRRESCSCPYASAAC